MTGRAKWHAWTQAGQTWGPGRECDAENRYLDIAKELGWTEGEEGCSGQTSRPVSFSESELDSGSHHHVGSGGGMGNSVSTPLVPVVEAGDLDTLHGLAVSNNLSGVDAFLQDHLDADVNSTDEFVRVWQKKRPCFS